MLYKIIIDSTFFLVIRVAIINKEMEIVMEEHKQEDQCKLLTIKEAAKLTRTAEGTWRHWLMGLGEGMPPVRVIRLGRAVRIHRQDLLNWIETGAVVSPRRRRGRPTKAEQMRQR